jgi:uncharacterized protein YkwD
MKRKHIWLTSRQACFVLLVLLLSFRATCAQEIVPPNETRVVTKEMTGPYRPKSQADAAKCADLIVAQTNEFRKEQGLPPVAPNEILKQTAQSFAQFMAQTGKYGHEADGQAPTERATAQGYDLCFLAENIAMEFKSNGFATGALAKSFTTGWKNSPAHRENMLRPGVTEIGVAVAQSAETGAYFAVQLFGRPKSQAIEFRITNQLEEAAGYRVGSDSFVLQPGAGRMHSLCQPAAVKLDDPPAAPAITPERGDRLEIVQAAAGTSLQKAAQAITP